MEEYNMSAVLNPIISVLFPGLTFLYHIKPLSMITSVLIQMPIFMSMYSLFMNHGSSITSILVPWVQALSDIDNLHILPLVVAGSTFLIHFIPLTSEVAISAGIQQKVILSSIISIVFLIFMWRSPVALALYWGSNSLFASLEKGLYRIRLGKHLLAKEF
jgi:YidC/Oxa1 family membrane protein insertase